MSFPDFSKAAKAAKDLGRELRIVSLYMPATAPWPFNTWWGPKLHPLAAALTMEFAAIEMASKGAEIRWFIPRKQPSISEITVGEIDASSIRAVRAEEDFALRDVATNEIVGFSACKFLKADPLGGFYVDRPSDEEYQRLLDERRKKDKEDNDG